MKLGDYHFITHINSFICTRLTLDEDFTVIEFEQSFRELFGEYMNLPFPEIGYTEKDKAEIREFFDEIKQNGSSRVATLVMDRNDKPHFIDLMGSYRENQDACYEIRFFDVPDMEDDCLLFRDNMWKYRVMLGLSELVFFDYDMTEDMVCCYRYVGKKSVRLFYGNFEGFEKTVRENAEQTDNNLVLIDKFLGHLQGAKNTFEITFKSGFLHIDHKIQRLHIRGRFDDMNGHRNMYAVINNLNETDEDLPFYMTAAGMDSATGLLSKRSLIEYSEDILTVPATASRGHYMVLLDVDDFKNVNDNFGHQTGDKVIQLLATTLMDVVGDAGIIGRYGGDEFYILTDMISDEDMLRTMLRNIRGTMGLRAKEELGLEKVTLSIGVSTYPDNGKNFNDLLFLADKALYIAKEKGKDRYIIYRPELHDSIKTGVDRQGFSSYSEQAKATNLAVRALFTKGKAAIEENLPIITKGFDLDGIEIFTGKDLELTYSFGKYDLDMNADFFLKNEKYISRFDESGLMVLNNYNNLKKIIPEIYEKLAEKRCFSLIQVALPSPKEPEYFVSFFVMNRNHQWSDAEKSNLALYGSLIYEVLKEDK